MAFGFILESGWPSCGYADCDTSLIPGTGVSIPIQIGEPNTILKAFLADLNAYVEPYNGQNDVGGWTPTNSVPTSNHLGGIASDWNWDDHPMGPAAEDPAAGWQGSSLINGDEVPAVRALLDFYEGMVYWGADWTTPKDSMHFQMGYGTYDGGNTGDPWTPAMHSDASCMAFIKRKIRSDMFSVYRRGGTSQGDVVWPVGVTTGVAPPSTPVPPPSTVTTGPTPVQPVGDTTSPAGTDPATVLVAATGVSADTAAKILPDVTQGLIDSQCTNINRIAMWLAQIGEESAGFTATVEIGTIDGTTYQGRTWIQITGAANYASFSQWAYANNVPGVTSPTYFVDNPAALGDLQYAAIGPAWYWTVARPQINGLCDNGDVVGVTQAINGGQNGIDDRTRRWNLALAQGNDLLTLIQQPATTTTPGGPLMALTDDEQQELLDKVRYISDQVGPRLAAWGNASSFGTYPDGSEMTERDGLIAKLDELAALLKATPTVLTGEAVCQIAKWMLASPAVPVSTTTTTTTTPVVAPSTVRPSPPPTS